LDGLGEYGRSEQQSMYSIVQFAITKRIEEAERLQYAPWMLCNQMQRSIHRLDFFCFFFLSSGCCTTKFYFVIVTGSV